MAIESAQQAADQANQFISKYYQFRRLQKAQRQDGVWVVEFDVGILETRIARIKLDAETGTILEYTSA
ncbi:MAG: hypothetical protein HY673_05615 [Chloroflexi bacterium]|nr:hypothetical protein [Chloroflexota bacterium]